MFCCRGIIAENEEFVNAVINAQTELKANPTPDEILYEIGNLIQTFYYINTFMSSF